MSLKPLTLIRPLISVKLILLPLNELLPENLGLILIDLLALSLQLNS
jgi:hypothetical protein